MEEWDNPFHGAVYYAYGERDLCDDCYNFHAPANILCFGLVGKFMYALAELFWLRRIMQVVRRLTAFSPSQLVAAFMCNHAVIPK